MKKKIMRNWGWKLASLLIAFILWFAVVQFTNPPDTVTFNNVLVTMSNMDMLEKENKMYEVLDGSNTVRVTVKAPRSVIKELRSSDIIAEADVSRLTEVNTIPITLTVLNADKDSITSITSSPEVVRLNVEERDSKWIRVQYATVGEAAEGYMVGNVTADQTMVEVSGPKSAVEEISYAGIEIDVTGATTNLSANVELKLYDAEKKQLQFSNIEQNVNYIRMSVEVLAVKEVPVDLKVMGTPAEGYLATGVVKCDPPTVMIAGTVSTLAGINAISVSEEELDITGENSDLETVIKLRDYLPDNVRLADSSFNGRVTATVYIEPEFTRKFSIPESNISFINLPEGIEASPTGGVESYELKVSGLEEAVSLLQQNTIEGSVDVAAWMEKEKLTDITGKSYTLPVTFNLGEDIIIEKEVEIKVVFRKAEE